MQPAVPVTSCSSPSPPRLGCAKGRVSMHEGGAHLTPNPLDRSNRHQQNRRQHQRVLTLGAFRIPLWGPYDPKIKERTKRQ